MQSFVLLSALALAVSAQDYGPPIEQHAAAVCAPDQLSNYTSTQAKELTPCNAVYILMAECTEGSISDSGSGSDDDQPCYPGSHSRCSLTFSNATQRACICGSQFFDLFNGCMDCYKAHGLSDLVSAIPAQSAIPKVSSSYCAVASQPTIGFADVLGDLVGGDRIGDSSSESALSTATWSDPIGNKTDVSLYFTPAVTGTDAYQVALATVTPTKGEAYGTEVRISTSTSGGYLVPTATPNNKQASSSKSSDSSKSSSGMGVQQTALGGVIGLAALAAIL